MTNARHIETARKHLAAGNVDAYKAYMRAMFRRVMSAGRSGTDETISNANLEG